jgi:hypothetical protein
MGAVAWGLWPTPRFPSPLIGRVGDWRAGLGRSLCSLFNTLQRVLGRELSSDLRTLYWDHGGIRSRFRLPMRMLSPTEVADTLLAVRENFPDLLDETAGLFWTDDNSNYGGVFLARPLSGRVFFLDHEEPNDAPRFRNVQSFCRSMLGAIDHEWVEMATDYPRLTDPADIENDEDRSIAVGYLRRLGATQSPDEYSRLAHHALNLLPPQDFALALPLFGSDDMWVQERTCQVMGLWRCVDAIPDLLRVGQTGMGNGRVAAVRALQRIDTVDARRAVNLLRADMGPQYEWLFRTAGPPSYWR